MLFDRDAENSLEVSVVGHVSPIGTTASRCNSLCHCSLRLHRLANGKFKFGAGALIVELRARKSCLGFGFCHLGRQQIKIRRQLRVVSCLTKSQRLIR